MKVTVNYFFLEGILISLMWFMDVTNFCVLWLPPFPFLPEDIVFIELNIFLLLIPSLLCQRDSKSQIPLLFIKP